MHVIVVNMCKNSTYTFTVDKYLGNPFILTPRGNVVRLSKVECHAKPLEKSTMHKPANYKKPMVS